MKLIANFGAGVDHIDLASARQRNITVTNTPGVLTEDTADMTLALILAVPRRLHEGERLLPKWRMDRMVTDRHDRVPYLGQAARHHWYGPKSVRRVARRAKAFGMSIHYHNRHRVGADMEEELEATYWESLDQMLARMDIISVNCPPYPGDLSPVVGSTVETDAKACLCHQQPPAGKSLMRMH